MEASSSAGNLHPFDLTEALSVTPFLHLIPKQDVAPLLSSANIDPVSPDIEEGAGAGQRLSANKTRSALNENPENFKDVISFLVDEFSAFQDKELDNIAFKKPIIAGETGKVHDSDLLNLPPLERQIYDSMKDIEDSSLKEFDLDLGLNGGDDDDAKLVLRTCAGINDSSKIAKHNKKLSKKFDRELSPKESIPTTQTHQESTAIKKTSTNMHELTDNQLASLKHSIENDQQFMSQNSDPNKLQKTTYIDQNVIMQQAFDSLVNLINESGILGSNISPDPKYRWTTKGNIDVISNSVLVSIFDKLLRIYNDPIIDHLDIEYLIQIQRSCLQSVHIGVESNWNEITQLVESQGKDEFNHWISAASHHILASKIILMILSGRRKDKQLFMDSYLKSIVDFISNFIQDGLLPSASKHATNPEIHYQFRNFSSYIASELGTILTCISSLLNGNEVNEDLLTKLEYLTIQAIFHEANYNKRISLLDPTLLERLSACSCQILVVIHKNYEGQRNFILNEVLTNFDKLPHQKSIARQVKLPRGGEVQLATVLLLKLIQSFDITKYSGAAKDIKRLRNDDKAARLNLQSKREYIVNDCFLLLQSASRASSVIATFFVNKLSTNPDQNYKATFILFLEDLTNILTLPEWPGVELLLSSIMKAFLAIIQAGSQTALMETYSLEMAGNIGSRLLEIKKLNIPSHFLHFDSSEYEFNAFKISLIDTLQYVKLQSNKADEYRAAFKFLLLKYICLLHPFFINMNNDKENQIAALNSDKTDSQQGLANMQLVNGILDELLSVLADDTVSMNQTLTSDKDSLSISSYISILLSQELIALYDSFINTIVRSLDNTKIKARTRAVKVLSSLIDQDASLLLVPKIQDSVSKSLLDHSPLVRDAVIELISRYMLLKVELIDQFYKPICDRSNDESVLVRKRVIKLSKEMYINTKKRNVRCYIAIRLLKRLDDEEDNLIDMAKQVLDDLWFCTTPNELPTALMVQAEVMMDIVSSNAKNTKLFQTFISDFIIRDKKNSSSNNPMKLITDRTLDFILDSVDSKEQNEVEKALILVSNFVRCDGLLMTQDQLVILQPYLVDEKNSSVCFYCLQILKHVLPEFTALRPDFVESTQSYLLKKLTKFDVRELHQAMPSVWLLCRMTNNTIKLCNASISCMRLVKPFMENAKTAGLLDPDQKLIKLLHLLGCFGSYCDFEKYRDNFKKPGVGLKSNETVTSLITKFLLFFCDSMFDSQVKSTSIRNIIHICTYHPKLFMSESVLKILDREFKGSSMGIKHTIIQGIIGFLNKEDSDSQKRNGAEEKSSTELKLDVAVFHGESQSYVNDGICAGIIQRYIGDVLDLCLYDSGESSSLPAQFLQIVVRLGFANPKVCIPTIIALESSPNPYIRRIAAGLHQEIFEKHESLSDSSYLEGLRLTMRYKKAVSGNHMFQSTFHLQAIYQIVNKSYSSRKKYMQSLTKVFSIKIDGLHFQDALDQRNLVIYCIINLLKLQFCSIEEILMLIHLMDRTISVQALDLAKRVSKQTQKEKESSFPELQLNCINSQTLIAIINYRSNIISSHNITSMQIEGYRPNKADIENRHVPKISIVTPFPLDNIELGVNLNDLQEFSIVFTRLLQEVRAFV